MVSWLKKRGPKFLAAVATGLLIVWSGPPHDVYVLAWFGLVPLLLALRGETGWGAFRLGLLAGVVVNYGGFHWTAELMERYSNLGPATWLILAVFATYQGLVFAFWAALARLLSQDWSEALVYPVVYTAVEYFLPMVFPWYLANTQHQFVLVCQSMELGGPSLVTLVLVSLNLALAHAVLGLARKEGFRGAVVMAGLAVFGLNLLYGAVRIPQIDALIAAAPKFKVGLVQPDIWIRELDAATAAHRYQWLTSRLVEESKPDLVVLPESAIKTPVGPHTRRGSVPGMVGSHFPLDLEYLEPSARPPEEMLGRDQALNPGYLERVAVQRGHKTPMLFGATAIDLGPAARHPIEGKQPLYNAAFLLDGTGRALGYALKNKLLIFGEYIPFSHYFPQVYRLLPYASALLAGSEPAVLALGQARMGIMICYEDLIPWFGLELAELSPNLLVNMSNEAWFGRTGEPAAHLALAKARTIEHRLFLVRVTTTGISAVIDPVGRSRLELGVGEMRTAAYEVALMETRTLYQLVGNLVPWLCALATLSGLAAFRRRPA